ncbi:alanine racemase [Desulfitobacterium metallireducens]|uniref:Alanine racemase n=1 Tax=Desulfitobacterium metallireducens DSM 15288 TaxID=871968 RepID=W0EAU4_9FIRM|nr:alanine racemase [Desulfitobacterium metallireducens]AHF06339.1 alanine racemase [Desulfitobacterium metallireducens DSM 15288]
MENARPVWTEVDLSALKRNYERIKTYTKSEIMPIVKADAYGHGAIPVVKVLFEAGARRFGVALLEEALEIKRSFPSAKVMTIGYMSTDFARTIVEEDIISGVYQYAQAESLSRAATDLGKNATIHFKIDTGMGRIGFRKETYEEILQIAKLPNLYIEGIYTHFANSDQLDLSFAREQLKTFLNVCERLQAQGIDIPIRHAANSAAILQFPEAHLDLVRPGIILYGLPPSSQVGGNEGFEPVMTWKAKIAHIKEIQAGETVSYGRTFRAAYPTRVATLPVGYADGLNRALSNRGEMLVKGRRAAIIGRICMDQTMLDITRIHGVDVGTPVTLLGSDGYERIDATEMAKWLETINYEVLCDISKRVPRVYIEK